MKLRLKHVGVGDIVKSKNGPIKILKIINSRKIQIQFVDPPCLVKWVTAGNVRTGNVGLRERKPRSSKRRVFGIGFVGNGPYETNEAGQMTIAYKAWRRMLGETSVDVTVDREWHDFQSFAAWFHGQLDGYGQWQTTSFRWTLNRTLLVPGNQQYSPALCCVVPHQMHNLIRAGDPERDFLPIGVSRSGLRFVAYCRQKCLGTFDKVQDAQCAYWVEKIASVREAAERFRSWMPPALYDRLSRFDWSDVHAYYGVKARMWNEDNTPPS